METLPWSTRGVSQQLKALYLLFQAEVQGDIPIQHKGYVGAAEAGGTKEHEHCCPPEHAVWLDRPQDTIPTRQTQQGSSLSAHQADHCCPPEHAVHVDRPQDTIPTRQAQQALSLLAHQAALA